MGGSTLTDGQIRLSLSQHIFYRRMVAESMSPRLLFLLTVLLSGKFFFQLFLKAEALKLKKHANFVDHQKDPFVNCIDPKELADCRFINDARQFRIEPTRRRRTRWRRPWRS